MSDGSQSWDRFAYQRFEEVCQSKLCYYDSTNTVTNGRKGDFAGASSDSRGFWISSDGITNSSPRANNKSNRSTTVIFVLLGSES